MEILSPGIKEGTLYQMTSQSEIDGEIGHSFGIARGMVYGMRINIDDILSDPKIPHSEVDSIIKRVRRFDVYTQYSDHLLDRLIDEAARAFARNAVIKTLDESFFIKYRREVFIKDAKNNSFLYKRYSPVPEGVLQYFRTEMRRKRKKLISEID